MKRTTAPIILTNHGYRFTVAEQLQQTGIKAEIFLEPCFKGTAPATILAALHAAECGQSQWLLVLPSDHYIEDHNEWSQLIDLAIARYNDQLVTFGIEPARPETGYGYIKVNRQAGESIYPISQFREKPPLELARKYLESPNYLWNSGIFLFPVDTFLREIRQWAPDMLACCRKAYARIASDPDFIRIPEQSYATCPSQSIDKALMEKTSHAVVAAVTSGWSDIGSWESIWEASPKDSNGNSSEGLVKTIDCSNSLFRSGKRLIAGLGLTNLIVVDSEDAILVADKKRVQDVSQLYALLHEHDSDTP